MVEITLHRVLLKPDDLVKEKQVEGTDIRLALAYENDARVEASIQQGHIVAVGPTAFRAYDIPKDKEPKVGDFVLWAKYAGVGVIDPETKEKLVVLNDEDVLCILKRGEK